MSKYLVFAALAVSCLAAATAEAQCQIPNSPVRGPRDYFWQPGAVSYVPAGPSPWISAPYGPEHITYGYHARPRLHMETYTADYPRRGGPDWKFRRRANCRGERGFERWGP